MARSRRVSYCLSAVVFLGASLISYSPLYAEYVHFCTLSATENANSFGNMVRSGFIVVEHRRLVVVLR